MGPNSTLKEETDRPRYFLIGLWDRYSSWTARVRVLLDYYSIPYDMRMLNLWLESRAELNALSPSGLVPVLVDNKYDPPLNINDSLAILLHLAEEHPSLPFFPSDPYLRALARSATAEMHSGFVAMRNEFSANFIAKYEGAIPISDAARKNVKRVLEIWGNARRKTIERANEGGSKVKDEGYLCGEFGIVDAFFWPVLWRFRSYNLPLTTATPEAIEWISKMWNDPQLREVGKGYFRQAENPKSKVKHYDDVFKGVEGITYGKFDEDWVFRP
ncbi:putative glutathione S transferase [Mytilinidion resinicola]|uniref:Glutathione S transferase n=1 Tax=Mytilinidion resinicola TaxID=574789 RepID=A0A6A6YHQ9_9PEZI|nr:putative glutathione S transferase [Mytilinidion resinicola]KAF2808310.1 putative glutathione S transferase [Mytilinidion resinicola]